MAGRKSIAVIIVVLVSLPSLLAFVLGIRSAADAEALSRSRRADAAAAELAEIKATVDDYLYALTQSLDPLLEGSLASDADALRATVRTKASLKSLFFLKPDLSLVFPVREQASSLEKEFFTRYDFFSTFFFPLAGAGEGEHIDRGWFVYAWGGGEEVVRWVKTASGYAGAEIDAMALFSGLAAKLGTISRLDDVGATVRLHMRDGKVFFQWGGDVAHAQPMASVRLEPPLNAWSLEYLAHSEGGGGASLLPWILGAFGVLGALSLSIWILLRELGRELKLARDRQSFVNQVSHELKTPLTNVRLYAELLRRRLEDGGLQGTDPKMADYLEVIDNESLRLNRLIHNVLSFARLEKGRNLPLHPAEWDVGQVLVEYLRSFEAAFERIGIAVELAHEGDEKAVFDREIFEQILGNLLSNVEKYAAEGKWVMVETSVHLGRLDARVIDRGEGIPHAARERVFRPYERLHEKVSDAAGGTGLGLGIARDLARLHGGGLELEDSDTGARFHFWLLPARETDTTKEKRE